MSKTYVIAEAGVNHNGSLDLALKLIDCAVESGADAVKFQTFKTESLVTNHAAKAEYQAATTGSTESQFEMIKKLELSESDHLRLVKHCVLRKIQFLSAPFDLESVDFLVNGLKVPRLKLPSGEITNPLLLLKAAKTSLPIILSTGMCDLDDIKNALGVLAYGYLGSEEKPSIKSFKDSFDSIEGQRVLREKVILLHCTTEYPAPIEEVNLRAMDTMREVFGLQVGYSDHTLGVTIPVAAVALGAVIIEKHFTLDRNLPGPDHRASLEPNELKTMVEMIRQAEQALGSKDKIVTPSEEKNKLVARRSLVAACNIKKGERFSKENLAAKRPGSGVSLFKYWDLIGSSAEKDYSKDELI